MKKIKTLLSLLILSILPFTLFANTVEDFTVDNLHLNDILFNDNVIEDFAVGELPKNDIIFNDGDIKDYDIGTLPPLPLLPQNKESEHHFFVDGYFGPSTRIARKNTITVGGHVSVDFHIFKEFSLGTYIHGEYFFSPLGSTTGLLAGLETELEAGANITFPIFKRGNFMLKLGCDAGYYMQWLQYESSISVNTHLAFNGLMLRPTFTMQFTKLWGMPIGIAFYYQITAVVPYNDYNGFGMFIML